MYFTKKQTPLSEDTSLEILISTQKASNRSVPKANCRESKHGYSSLAHKLMDVPLDDKMATWMNAAKSWLPWVATLKRVEALEKELHGPEENPLPATKSHLAKI